jgi:hypothetical protein
LRERIAHLGLPEEIQARALKEVSRLNQMPPMSPEVGIIRTYLDWLVELPWSAATSDNLDVAHASRVLNRGHYALKKAKERTLEYIAVRSLAAGKQKQPILCFVGPPGTGKTSLGKSIAEALVATLRMSLVASAIAEIRGHRRIHQPCPDEPEDAAQHHQSASCSTRSTSSQRPRDRRRRCSKCSTRQNNAFRSLSGSPLRPFTDAVHHHRQHPEFRPAGPA